MSGELQNVVGGEAPDAGTPKPGSTPKGPSRTMSQVQFPAGGRMEVPEDENAKDQAIKQGTINFTWDNVEDQSSSKVPYWIIPDGLASDPFFVEKVIDAMRLQKPNMILRFSCVHNKIPEWKNCWDYDPQGIGMVDASTLPFDLPSGASLAPDDVRKYMSKVVQDRVESIIFGVTEACSQASAWLHVSDYEPGDDVVGMLDYLPVLLHKSMDKSSIVFSTYSMEERRKMTGGDNFCKALNEFSGIEKTEDLPKGFTEDISKAMDMLALSKSTNLEEEPRVKVAQKNSETSFKERSSWFAANKNYLPSKDLTHLLVFESKTTELLFKRQLYAQAATGDFIMAGRHAAMKLFNDAMKNATPVFVLKGTGGASDKASLVLAHMRYRAELDELGGSASDSGDEAGQEEATGWFGRGKNKIRDVADDLVTAAVEVGHQMGDLFAGDDEGSDDDDDQKLNLASLIKKIEKDFERVSKARTDSEASGEFVIATKQKLMQQSLEKLLAEGRALFEHANAIVAQPNPNAEEVEALVVAGRDIAEAHKQARNPNRKAKYEKADAKGPADWGTSAVEDDGGMSLASAASSKAPGGTKLKDKALRKAETPEELYKNDIDVGTAGSAWEKRMRMTYEEWLKESVSRPGLKRDPPEDDWTCPREGAPKCENGKLDKGQPGPCYRESCSGCFKAQKKERRNLRKLAKFTKPWSLIDKTLKQKYIAYWIEDHPITDDPALTKGGARDLVTEMARVCFANVWAPPNENACVEIGALDVDLNVEAIMDKVSEAMSTEALVNEVGEKTAFRRRLLIAWQGVHQLRFNSFNQGSLDKVLKMTIMTVNFLSVVAGTLTFKVSSYIDRWDQADKTPEHYLFPGMDLDATLEGLMYINVILPLLATVAMATDSSFTPARQDSQISGAHLYIESEIFKYRTRTGEYSGMSSGAAVQETKTETDGEGASEPKAHGGANRGATNPRQVFASHMEEVWAFLAASEVRQEALYYPEELELLPLDTNVTTQEHPSLFEEGEALNAPKRIRNETLSKRAYQVADDGLRALSAPDYIDLRVVPYEKAFELRAPRNAYALTVCQLFVFASTTVSSAFGAFNLSEWIPVMMALGAAFNGFIAFRQLEERLARSNAAVVSVRRLMIWWHGLSVIEKRLAGNKMFLVNTMEAVIQAEAGSTYIPTSKESGGEDGGDER